MLLTTLFMGCSTTLLKPVFINREQVERSYACITGLLIPYDQLAVKILKRPAPSWYSRFSVGLVNKGEFRSRRISAFVYIFVLNQSGCRKAKIVNKTSEKILSSSRALVNVNFNFFNLKPKYYDRTH